MLLIDKAEQSFAFILIAKLKDIKKADPKVGFFHPGNWIILQLVQQERLQQQEQLVQQERLQQQEQLVLLVQQEQLQQLVLLEQQLQQLVLVLLLFSSKRSKR